MSADPAPFDFSALASVSSLAMAIAQPSVMTGPVVGLLRADAGVASMVAATSIHADELPPEALLPLVVAQDISDKSIWQNEQARKESRTLRVTVRAGETNTPGARNPAEAIADLVEAALNWKNLTLAQTAPLRFERTTRVRTLEKRREPKAGRVYRVTIEWWVEYEQNL